MFDAKGRHISPLQRSKSISEDMEVKGERHALSWRSVTYWFGLQRITAAAAYRWCWLMNTLCQHCLHYVSPHLLIKKGASCTCVQSPTWLCTQEQHMIAGNKRQRHTHISINTQACICSCASHLPSVENVVILSSALSPEM